MTRNPAIIAGWLDRLFAYMIDTLILIVPNVICYMMLHGSDISLIFAFLCNLTYYTAFTASPWQATPGKRIMNMRVLRTDGQPLTQRDALERFLAYTLPSLPIYTSMLAENQTNILVVWLSLLWFSPILYTDERVAMHDRICKTRVVTGRMDA